MPATPISNTATGETLLGTEPQLQQQVDPGWWRERLNLFTGRTLTVDALDSEQFYRSSLLATLGQAVTAGVVSGLALTMDVSGPDPIFTVSSGYGIMPNGQDVALNTTLKTALSTLEVIDPISGADLGYTFHQLVGDPTNTTYAGVLLLQPVIAQVSGEVLDTGTPPIEVSGNLGASCAQDPTEYAFEDWQIADAVRLVYVSWPSGVPGLPLPAMAPQATWRNRLAYTIFEAEAMLGPDDALPWSIFGLPVALIAFNPGITWQANTAYTAGQYFTDPNGNLQVVEKAGTSGGTEPTNWSTALGGQTTDGGVTWVNNGYGWKPLFVDCSSVVRAGGLPRNRCVLPSEAALVLVWQSQTPVSVGAFIIDSNNKIQLVQTAGTTAGPVPPTWATAFGQTSKDGSVVWINNGSASWQPNTAYVANQFIFDSNNNQQRIQTPGTSGANPPTWNGIYLPTVDGTVTWINNGSGNPPLIQPALAQARINQLTEQLSQVMAQGQSFNTLADIFPTLPPSGILPAAAVNFSNHTAPWLPPNWTVSAAPVLLEELETVLETGMLMDLIPAETTAPEDTTLLEPVEVLVPLPDTVYDPNILVVDTVPPVFYQEATQATQARNLTLQKLETVQRETNALFTTLGPNLPVNPNLIDPDAGLTPDELAGRNAPPPYSPLSTETFGTVLQSTWQPSIAYTAGEFVIDSNGAIEVVVIAGTSGATAPTWNTNIAGTTTDGTTSPITWMNNGPWAWQPNTAYVKGQFVVDPQGFMQVVSSGGTSAAAPPAWLQPESAGQTRTDGSVTWQAAGKAFWQPSHAYTAGEMIIDANGNVESVTTSGTSATTVPTFDPNPGQSTKETTGLVWKNLGDATWQPNTNYTVGQVILDSGGDIQVVTVAGTSAATPPNWLQPEAQNQVTQDGIIWQAGGQALWQPDYLYGVGQLILDSNGNAQIVQTAGISSDSPPSWNPNPGQTTTDSGVVWNNLGHYKWQANTAYSAGQAIVDPTGNIQLATIGGTSGATQPAWTEGANATTLDAAVTWTNSGPLTWQASKAYTGGQIILDSNGNLQTVESVASAGTSGMTPPAWSTTPGGTTTDGSITWAYLAYASSDLLQLQTVANQAPYTSKFTDPSATATPPPSYPLNLLTTNDMNNWQTNGLQALLTSLNARISQANDLLDTAFLTAQTDIYRLRQNVLGSTAASALATSPVLANIATGETAAATAENLQNYITSILPSTTTTQTGSGANAATTATTTLPPTFNPVSVSILKNPVILSASSLAKAASTSTLAAKSQSVRSQALVTAISGLKTVATTLAPVSQVSVQQATSGLSAATVVFKAPTAALSAANLNLAKTAVLAGPTQIIAPGKNAPATSVDITDQSPLAGAQLSIRTLTIAERMAQSPSQEAMFYAIANRLSFLQSLQQLETNSGLFADDLPIIVDNPSASSSSTTQPTAVPTMTYSFSGWLGPTANQNYPNNQGTIQTAIQSPYVAADSSEATLYSVAVRVVEQHTMLLRALEGRVQQYSDFVALCTNAFNSIKTNIQNARVYATQLMNNLLQGRQNVAFTRALLADEIQQVQNTNAQRQQILQSSVQLIAYTRARTLEATDSAPSRQLVPANVTNPVPACLQQSVAIPPELREIVGQLREAPLSWLPSASLQVGNLERPVLLQQLALNTQARATQLLQMPQLPSSAAGEPGAYAPTIANVYTANQQVFRNLQTQRAAFQPAALTSMSWSLQVGTIQSIAAVNDLISSDSVHTEVSNAVARLIQQISSVATCLYTRVSIEDPVDRLAWANYLTGSGVSVQLQSLAILPSWNQLDYTDRQQMQMLVDWLFLQIDTTQSGAVAFMSDVVRTAILLASDVPVDNIIPGNVITRVQPAVGGVVSLTLPSDRIASGMYVNLYSGATLAARGVVSDLDTSTVTATVTDVYTPGTYLETNDSAHFTTLTPQAVALRPFMQS
jgi:hypothetical protein